MSVQLNINSRPVNINPVEMPDFSRKSAKIFEEILGNQDMVLATTLTSVKERASKLEDLVPKLQQAKNSSTRDKIIGFLAMALLIATAIAGISLMATGVAPLVGAALLGSYLLAATAISATPAYPIIPFIGPFVLLHKAFTKIPKLESQIKKLEGELPQDIVKINTFYKDNSNFLKDQLKNRIQQTKDSIAICAELPRKAETNLQELLKADETALKELESGAHYFSKVGNDVG